jgi:minor extracellular serine protease Vpr
LPTSLSGTWLTLDGVAAPLLAVANVGGLEQINLQVPWELEGRAQASLVVTNNGMSSTPVTIPLAVQPGLFAGSRDETLLQLWATGLGSVLTMPASGQAATASSTRDRVQVLVNGVGATVEYAGLAPGFAGLYQVNARLADSAPASPLDVQLRAGGSDSNLLQVK